MNIRPPLRAWLYRHSLAVLHCSTAILAGCGDDSGGSTDTASATGDRQAKSSLSRETSPQVSDADLAAVVAGNTDFALKALARIAPDGATNTVFSPYSITQALALAAAGARGTTLSGIDQALSFPLAQERLNPAFNKLDQQLKASTSGTITEEAGQRPQLDIVNDIWGQQGYPFLSSYLDTIALNFGAAPRWLDFSKAPENARQTINDRVAEQTNQKITNLLSPGALDSDTRLVLTNAIWFKANWAEPFSENGTESGPFHNRGGIATQVPFMHRVDYLAYGRGEDFQAIELPYVENKLSMLVVMPSGIDQFLPSLTPAKLGEITTALADQRVALSLPKFTVKSTADLLSVLSSLGMAEAFDKKKADFSGIDGSHELSIDQVVHQAFISADEKGTEATAATAVGMLAITSVDPTVALPVTIDQPFLFLIRDRQTGLILFIGKVVNL